MSEHEDIRPRVFVSYSWTSPSHEQRVLDLANRLISDGIEVTIDKYDLQEGQDLHAFMERMVTDKSISHVLVLSDRSYAEKANSRERGVGKEALIISAEVYERADQTKFLPIVFECVDGEPCLPVFMKGRVYIDMSTPEREAEDYEPLVRRIYGKPLLRKPPLGAQPTYLLDAPALALQTTARGSRAERAVLENLPYADAAIRDYFTGFVDALNALRLPMTAEEPLDVRVVASISAFLPYRDEFLKMAAFLASYRDSDATYEALHDFFESATQYLMPLRAGGVSDQRQADNLKFILGELFMHTVSVLIQQKRFARVRALTGQDYRINRGELGDRWQSFPIFHPNVQSIERDYQQRHQTNWVSASADLLKSRATGKPASFEELQQADLVLFLSSLLESDRAWSIWTPYTLLYAQRTQPLEIFARAESAKYFENLKLLFGVSSRDELVKGVMERGRANNMQGTLFLPNAGSVISYGELANLSKLASRP